MSHAYVRLVADRTDPFRPIPKQRTDPTRQEIHRESITRQVQRNKKETDESDYFEEFKNDKKARRDQKNRDKQHKKSMTKARDARHKVIYPPYEDEGQAPDHAEETESDSWTHGEHRDYWDGFDHEPSDEGEPDYAEETD